MKKRRCAGHIFMGKSLRVVESHCENIDVYHAIAHGVNQTMLVGDAATPQSVQIAF